MVGCQGQLDKLNFPCAVMHNRIYSKTHLLDGQEFTITQPATGGTLMCYPLQVMPSNHVQENRRTLIMLSAYHSVKLTCSFSEMLFACIHQMFNEVRNIAKDFMFLNYNKTRERKAVPTCNFTVL